MSKNQVPTRGRWQFSLTDLLLWTGLAGLMIFPFAYAKTAWMWPYVIVSDVIIVVLVLAARYDEEH